MSALLMILVLLATAAPASAQRIIERDAVGNRIGTLSHEGSRWVQRDRNGNETSYFVRESGHIVHRDPNGNPIGRATVER